MSDEECIWWNPKFTLSLEHFKGEPDVEKPHHANTRVNFQYFFDHEVRKTASKNKMRIKKIDVKCFVNTSKSWIKKEVLTNTNLPFLLKHEEGHFDLAEEYARLIKIKMNAKFNGKSFSYESMTIEGAVKEINEILGKEFQIYTNEYKKANERYDVETNYGRTISKQTEYNQRFNKLHNE